MMFIVISVVEFGTKISSLLPILLDLCKNMKMNYFDISLSELRSHDILSSTFVVVLSFLDNITMQRFLLFSYFSLNWDLSWTIFNGNISDFFTFFSELRSLLVRLGNSSTILYFSDNIAMEIFLIFTFLSELRSLVVRLGKGSRQMGATASQSTKLRKIFNLCWNIWERNIWKDKNILAIGVEMHQIVQSWTIGRWRLQSSEIWKDNLRNDFAKWVQLRCKVEWPSNKMIILRKFRQYL